MTKIFKNKVLAMHRFVTLQFFTMNKFCHKPYIYFSPWPCIGKKIKRKGDSNRS